MQNKFIIRENKGDIFRLKIPIHIAITTNGISAWAKKTKTTVGEAYEKSYEVIENTISQQINLKIPVITFALLSEDIAKDEERFNILIKTIPEFLEKLSQSKIIHENKIKIAIIGKWYDLPGPVVESIKKTIAETKDYDSFFLNLCLNYDGQEEIVDATKLIARQVKNDKIDPELITKETIKENLYSSSFIPPDLIIKNGKKKKTTGILLWDSINTKICFTDQFFPNFDNKELLDAIRDYQRGE